MSVALERVRETLLPAVNAAGADLEDLEVERAGRRSVVRLVVDRDGGVTLDDVAELSRAASEALDALDAAEPELLAGSYVLEVSSPGVDRPLTLARHWRRNVGRLVTVTRTDGSTVRGRLLAAAADRVEVEGCGPLDLSGVASGLVEVEFNAPRAGEPE